MNDLAEEGSCVAYDRPGNGWTASAPARSASAHTDELLAVLDATETPPPYVLVGHSVGGLLIRSVARRCPDLVAGLVFVDSSHPDQMQRSAAQRRGAPWVRQRLLSTRIRAAAGLLRPDTVAAGLLGLPESEMEAAQRLFTTQAFWRTACREFDAWQREWAPDAALGTDLGDLPVAVVTAGQQATLDPVHGQLQRELAGLSRTSQHDVVVGAGHEQLITNREHAGRVAGAVRWVRATAVADRNRS